VLVFSKDAEFGNGIVVYARQKGSNRWDMYSLTSDNLGRTTLLGIDYGLSSLWPYQNQVHILAQFSGGGGTVAPLYLYELYLPLMEVRDPFETQQVPGGTEKRQAIEVLIRPSMSPSAATTLQECSRVPVAGDVSLTVEATFDAGATQGISVHIYTSYDGTSWDTVELADSSGAPVFGSVPFSPGNAVRVTRDIPTSAGFIKAVVRNEDTQREVTSVKVVATVGE
jgi:hypothetical protein